MNLGRIRNRTVWDLRLIMWRLIFQCLPEVCLTASTENGIFSFSSKDESIGRCLFLEGRFEDEKIELAVQLATELGYISATNSGYLVDIGANVGTVCIPLVKKGVFSRALAFEPEPKNYSFLTKNVEINGLSETIRPFNCALSSSRGQMELKLSSTSYGDHRLSVAAPVCSHPQRRGQERAGITVPAYPLDDVVKMLKIQPQEIKLLWLDVQGHEKHVLEGASALIRFGVPVVAEFWPFGLSEAQISPEVFNTFISSHFSTFYDLAEKIPEKRPASEIAQLFALYPGQLFTDLLLVNDRDSVQPRGTEPDPVRNG
jgi:FkbM family methyltransferase